MLFLFALVSWPLFAACAASRLPLVPYPQYVRESDSPGGGFALSRDVQIVVEPQNVQADLAVLTLRRHVRQFAAGAGSDESAAVIRLAVQEHTGLGFEDYALNVSSSEVVVVVSFEAGLFYAVQTIIQLTPRTAAPSLPAVTIRDSPRYPWRGLMIDVSRHFFNSTEIRKIVRTMARFKLNTLHLHLTDDQGWRLPVASWPNLTQTGALSVDGARHSFPKGSLEGIVAYARQLHVAVLPEVDVPGHVQAAVSAYPALGNVDIPSWTPPARPSTTWGIKEYTLSPTNSSHQFLRAVFAALRPVFPHPLVHIGGDEVPDNQWKASAVARRTCGSECQSFFTRQICYLLEAQDRVAVAWDEVLDHDFCPRGLVMAWRGPAAVRRALDSGHMVITADSSLYYFDRPQGPVETEPPAGGQPLTLSQVYGADPLPEGTPPSQQSKLLGGQGQLWTEHIGSQEHLEYMAFPRALALAERLWTPNANVVGIEEFVQRLSVRLGDLEADGVHFRPLDRPVELMGQVAVTDQSS